MEDTLRDVLPCSMTEKTSVLILVLMEDTLRGPLNVLKLGRFASLNPCFNGRYSQSLAITRNQSVNSVLILVLMEDTLRDMNKDLIPELKAVLILVLMEDTLRVIKKYY